jgi:hypothetical protein
MVGKRPTVNAGQRPEGIGVEDDGLWQVLPEVRHDLDDGVGATEPGTDGYRVSVPGAGFDLLEGVAGKRPVGPIGEASGLKRTRSGPNSSRSLAWKAIDMGRPT